MSEDEEVNGEVRVRGAGAGKGREWRGRNGKEVVGGRNGGERREDGRRKVRMYSTL